MYIVRFRPSMSTSIGTKAFATTPSNSQGGEVPYIGRFPRDLEVGMRRKLGDKIPGREPGFDVGTSLAATS